MLLPRGPLVVQLFWRVLAAERRAQEIVVHCAAGTRRHAGQREGACCAARAARACVGVRQAPVQSKRWPWNIEPAPSMMFLYREPSAYGTRPELWSQI